MAKKDRRTNILFEIAGRWIKAEPDRTGYFQYWYDPGTQTVRRKKLGSEDLEAAKLELAEIVLRQETPSASTLLAQVLLKYHEEHSDALVSGKFARLASRKLLAHVGAEAEVDDLTEEAQRGFVQKLAADGAAIAYIHRILSVFSAAFAHARSDKASQRTTSPPSWDIGARICA